MGESKGEGVLRLIPGATWQVYSGSSLFGFKVEEEQSKYETSLTEYLQEQVEQNAIGTKTSNNNKTNGKYHNKSNNEQKLTIRAEFSLSNLNATNNEEKMDEDIIYKLSDQVILLQVKTTTNNNKSNDDSDDKLVFTMILFSSSNFTSKTTSSNIHDSDQEEDISQEEEHMNKNTFFPNNSNHNNNHNSSLFRSFPVILIRGVHKVSLCILSWFESCFDCKIQPSWYTSYDLVYLSGLWTTCLDQKLPSEVSSLKSSPTAPSSQRSSMTCFEYTFEVPRIINGIRTVKISIGKKDMIKLCEVLGLDQRGEGEEEEWSQLEREEQAGKLLLGAIEDHIEKNCGIVMKHFVISKINTPFAAMSSDGKIKFCTAHSRSLETALRYMLFLSLNKKTSFVTQPI